MSALPKQNYGITRHLGEMGTRIFLNFIKAAPRDSDFASEQVHFVTYLIRGKIPFSNGIISYLPKKMSSVCKYGHVLLYSERYITRERVPVVEGTKVAGFLYLDNTCTLVFLFTLWLCQKETPERIPYVACSTWIRVPTEQFRFTFIEFS